MSKIMLTGDKIDGCKEVLEEIIDHTRWEVHYRRVFEYEGKHYEVFESRGATEHQDCGEWWRDEHECHEVISVEKKVIEWVRLEEGSDKK